MIFCFWSCDELLICAKVKTINFVTHCTSSSSLFDLPDHRELPRVHSNNFLCCISLYTATNNIFLGKDKADFFNFYQKARNKPCTAALGKLYGVRYPGWILNVSTGMEIKWTTLIKFSLLDAINVSPGFEQKVIFFLIVACILQFAHYFLVTSIFLANWTLRDTTQRWKTVVWWIWTPFALLKMLEIWVEGGNLCLKLGPFGV